MSRAAFSLSTFFSPESIENSMTSFEPNAQHPKPTTKSLTLLAKP